MSNSPIGGAVVKDLAVLTVRNEGAFLLDWIAHHRAVGFTDFLVFSNDCDDGTDLMLDHLARQDWLTHMRNDGPHDSAGIQFTALKKARKLDVVQTADWILPLDIDEFVNVHVGDRTLDALRAALPEATAITLTWRLFGNSGEVRYREGPVTEIFTRCAPAIMHWPWRASMFKTLHRNDGTYRKLGVHRPRSPDATRLDTARWFDGEGRELDAQFRTRRIFSTFGRSNTGLVQLNHYPLGAMESYVLKADRGRAVHDADMLGLDYWVERNFNSQEDLSIQALSGPTAKERKMMMSDPVLAALHKDAVAWRHSRFDALMLLEPYRALFGRLLMCPPSQPLTRTAARFLIRHGNRARVAQNQQIP